MNKIDLLVLQNLGDGSSVSDSACPLCGPNCRSPSNRIRKVLRIWNEDGFITYKCARCEASGWAHDSDAKHRTLIHKPKVATNRTELARLLWSWSQTIKGTLAETYLRSRQCFIESDTLRFLPAQNSHPPAMIARFGAGPVCGIHLTRLAHDGKNKAGTGKDKIMLGPSLGEPIIISENPDSGDLYIAEGIEDAASLALCTGSTAHAAGAASRVAAVVAKASNFERVFLAVDNDAAGYTALAKAIAIRPDLIPLNVAKILGRNNKFDANMALIRLGSDALRAAIEWSAAKTAFASGQIGFHTMQREIGAAEGVFHRLVNK